MFGEMSLVAWMGSAIILAIGGAAGFFVARQIKDKRTIELEQKLEATQNKLNEYQEDVNRHFLKTSLLFSKLTDNYRDVYEHLATGAQKLCTDKPHISALDLPEAKILSAALATDASTAINTEERPPEEAHFASPNTPAENEHDETALLGAESIVRAETITTQNTATTPEQDTEQPEQIMTEQKTTESADTEATSTDSPTSEPASKEPLAALAEKVAATQNKTDADTPTISAVELKILEANEQKKADEEDIPLGAESTPGVELEHHKTHPSIH